MATLTYVYADQTAVLGPLATLAEPHTYDLCADHSQRMSAPRGWNVLRLAPDPATVEPTHDDLLALADAVREAGRPVPTPEPAGPPSLHLVKSPADSVTEPPGEPVAQPSGDPVTQPPGGGN